MHAEVDDVGDDLRVCLCLVVAAHHAERHDRAPFLASIAGTNVCVTACVAGLVQVTRLQREARAAIVQRNAGLVGRKPAPKLPKSDWMNGSTFPSPSAAVR
jgi:hypothetical protein